MDVRAQVRRKRPLSTAVAIAVAAAALSVVGTGAAEAQIRGNAQADQSRALRARGGLTIAPPPVGRYAAETGEAFTLDRSGRQALLRFEGRDETWVLRPAPAPRGDVVYRNDAGQQVLRVTPSGAMTVFTARAPGGSPASLSGAATALTQPNLGPAQLFQLITRRSYLLSQAVGRLIEINVDTNPRAEGLTVEALVVATDAVLRIARSPTARGALARLRSISIVEGPRATVSYVNGQLRIAVAPAQGVAGRPSSARILRSLMAQER